MYFIELAQRYLLVTVAVITLCSLSLDAMPLSWSKTVKHRRSADSSETEIPTLPTDAGTVRLQEVDAPTAPGGGLDNKTSMHDCMKECYDYIPEENLTTLRQKVMNVSPHPSFLLSEMAENIHREEFCRRIGKLKNDEPIFCENENPQLFEEVYNHTKKHLSNYLNPNSDTSGRRYTIEYNANNYPRYKIQVECPPQYTKIEVANGMFYLRNTTSGWELSQYAEAVVGCRC